MTRYLGKGAESATRDGDGLALTWVRRRMPRPVREGVKVPDAAALTYATLATGDIVTDPSGRWHVTEVRKTGSFGVDPIFDVDLTAMPHS